MRPVNPRRRYNATSRRDQALRNREAILRHAHQLFVQHGYVGTTMAAIAADAGVSVETIYKSIGNKPAVLKAVLDVAIVGDHAAVPMLHALWSPSSAPSPTPARSSSATDNMWLTHGHAKFPCNSCYGPLPPWMPKHEHSGRPSRTNGWSACRHSRAIWLNVGPSEPA